MNKWFLFSLCILFSAVFSPLQAGEDKDSSPDSVRERIDSSVWIKGESPHLTPVCFTGVISKRDTWEINILSLNGHELPEPMNVALEKEPEGFPSATSTPCCGIIPVLVPCGAEGDPIRWRDAGAFPSVVMENTPQTLSCLQDAVLQSYQHHVMRSLKMSASLLDRMTDEKQTLALEKNWTYEVQEWLFWILMESSLPLEARMDYIKRNLADLEQTQKEAEACLEKIHSFRSKPWSNKLRLLHLF